MKKNKMLVLDIPSNGNQKNVPKQHKDSKIDEIRRKDLLGMYRCLNALLTFAIIAAAF
jgi:hypothetical protein